MFRILQQLIWVFGGLAFFGSDLLADVPVKEDEIKVELLEAGGASKKLLRIRPAIGSKHTGVMTLKMNMAMSMNGAQQPAMPTPTQKMTIELTVKDVTKEGDIHYDFRYLSAEVLPDPTIPEPMMAAVRKNLEPLTRMTGKGVVNDRGITQHGELDIPADTDPLVKTLLEGMKESLNRLSAPVPVEPIGIGGIWKVTQPMVANGMRIVTITTNELTKFTDNGFEVRVNVTQEAKPQQVNNPALPAGVTLMLDSLDSNGTAENKISLISLLPVDSVMKMTSSTKMNMTIGGVNQAMGTKMEMELTMSQPSQ